MKNKANKFLCLLLTVMMVLGLTACGKDKQSSDQSSDPNHIVIDEYELQYKNASIMTDDEGNDAVVLTLDYTNNSKEDAAFWVTVYEKAMQDGVQLDMAFVYPDPDSYTSITEDKYTDVAPGKTFEVHTAFVLRDTTSPVEVKFSDLFEEKGGTITIGPTTLAREGVQTASDTDTTDMSDDSSETAALASTGDPLLDWWNGEWYGWWMITGADGGYESSNNQWWDCCARINISADYTGSILIWDEDMPQENALSEASVTLNSAGTGEYGTLTSEGGYFLRSELAHADWIVDPGIMNYENFICIDGWYEDENGSFHYNIYLRPWGTLWDDIAADNTENLPYGYESWYLPLVNAGKAMPDKLGEIPQDGISEDEVNPQGSAEQPESNTGDAAETDGDYGKSNAGAVGIARLEDMQALYKICFENRTSAEHLFNYEDAREALGCDGVVRKTASYTWNETKHTYRWETEDGKDYFQISFGLEGDEEWYESCNMSENVINGLW